MYGSNNPTYSEANATSPYFPLVFCSLILHMFILMPIYSAYIGNDEAKINKGTDFKARVQKQLRFLMHTIQRFYTSPGKGGTNSEKLQCGT